MIERIKGEPLAVLEMVKWGLVAATAFYAPVTDEQKVAIVGLVASVLTFYTRRKVTPTFKVEKDSAK